LELAGHEKKVVGIQWHPTSNGVLASAGYDKTVKVWDIEAQNIVLDYKTQHQETLQSLNWNRNGSLLITTAKDKKMRIFDPRSQEVVAEMQPFTGGKKIQRRLP